MSQIIATLNQIAKGRAIADADAQLATLIEQVKSTGRPGKLALALIVGPSKISGALQLELESKATAPKAERQASLFFVGKDGRLTRDDPQRPEFPAVVDWKTARAEGAAPDAAPPSPTYPESEEKFGTSS